MTAKKKKVYTNLIFLIHLAFIWYWAPYIGGASAFDHIRSFFSSGLDADYILNLILALSPLSVIVIGIVDFFAGAKVNGVLLIVNVAIMTIAFILFAVGYLSSAGLSIMDWGYYDVMALSIGLLINRTK